jgi:hypothetical protein
MKREQKSALEALANEFCELDRERLELDRRNRLLKRRLKALQEGIQEFIGIADVVDVPLVSRIGKFFITQIKKHRGVPAYEYDFVEFKIIQSENPFSK